MELFVKCLTALPNLHTLEIVLMWKLEPVEAFRTAVMKGGPRFQLQRLRRLIIPSTAHLLLRFCPNVEDFTCGSISNPLVGSLVAGGLKQLTKLSVVNVYKGGRDAWLSRDHFVSRSAPTR